MALCMSVSNIPPEVLSRLAAEYEFRPCGARLGPKLSSQGSMSSVYSATLHSDNDCVVKVVDTAAASSLVNDSAFQEILVTALRREASLLRSLDHLNVQRFIGFDEVPGRIGLVSARESSGSLVEHLRSSWPLDSGAIRLCLEVASGLAYLHSLGIAHRDVKPANVFVGDVAKLGDFGLASIVRDLDLASELYQSSTSAGVSIPRFSPAFAAPEVIRCSISPRPYDARRADMFSFGLVVWCVLSGPDRLPFPPLPPTDHLQRLDSGHLPEMDLSWPEPLRAVVTACLALDPALRPTSADVVAFLRDGIALPSSHSPSSSGDALMDEADVDLDWLLRAVSHGGVPSSTLVVGLDASGSPVPYPGTHKPPPGPLCKNGVPDMRFRVNKEWASSSSDALSSWSQYAKACPTLARTSEGEISPLRSSCLPIASVSVLPDDEELSDDDLATDPVLPTKALTAPPRATPVASDPYAGYSGPRKSDGSPDYRTREGKAWRAAHPESVIQTPDPYAGYSGSRKSDGSPDYRTREGKAWRAAFEGTASATTPPVRRAISYDPPSATSSVYTTPRATPVASDPYAGYSGSRKSDGSPDYRTREGKAWRAAH
jgi:serine/threonine protein kinase